MKFGAHVSVAGGLLHTFSNAEEITADVAQIFLGSPRTWKTPHYSTAQATEFLQAQEKIDMPVYVHANYLINPAGEPGEKRDKSLAALRATFHNSNQLGIQGLVVHLGSNSSIERGIELVAQMCNDVLSKNKDGSTKLLLETSSGGGGKVGSLFSEIGAIISKVENKERIGVCLDTCHVYAAGYPLNTGQEVDEMVAQFDREIGLNYLYCLHLNDSKGKLGSALDRHENIGEGNIGLEGFRALVNHPDLQEIPGILEVPGFDNDGPDLRNIQILKSLQ